MCILRKSTESVSYTQCWQRVDQAWYTKQRNSNILLRFSSTPFCWIQLWEGNKARGRHQVTFYILCLTFVVRGHRTSEEREKKLENVQLRKLAVWSELCRVAGKTSQYECRVCCNICLRNRIQESYEHESFFKLELWVPFIAEASQIDHKSDRVGEIWRTYGKACGK